MSPPSDLWRTTPPRLDPGAMERALAASRAVRSRWPARRACMAWRPAGSVGAGRSGTVARFG